MSGINISKLGLDNIRTVQKLKTISEQITVDEKNTRLHLDEALDEAYKELRDNIRIIRSERSGSPLSKVPVQHPLHTQDLLNCYMTAINKVDDYFEYRAESDRDKRKVKFILEELLQDLETLAPDTREE
jgi:hypothetical protein